MLKNKLCDAPILSLPEGSVNFMVYCDASHKGLGCVLMQRDKVIAYASRQLKKHEKNYTTHDLELGAVVLAMKIWRHYLYGKKCTVFTDHQSLHHILKQKMLNMRHRRWVELLSDYDCELKYHPGKANTSLISHILEAQQEAMKEENLKKVALSGANEKLEIRASGIKYLNGRAWILKVYNLRKVVMDEAHRSRYSIHLGAEKMYMDVKEYYWWLEMKRDIALYQPEIPVWKWEKITTDLVTRLPRTSRGHDSILIIVDRLTKSAHFLLIRGDYPLEKFVGLYINDILSKNGVPLSIISDRDSRFTSRFWRLLQKAVDTQLDMSTAYHPKRTNITKERYRPWKKWKPLEFQVEDQVLLKVSPWKCTIRFGKRGKLNPRYTGPYKVMDIHKRTNNEAKRTKPSTGMEKVKEIEAEGKNEGLRSLGFEAV
ncbi:putative reverse transcriptase domain-containing protein [Tanacetum coccineum]